MEHISRVLASLALLAGCSCGGARSEAPTAPPRSSTAVTYEVHEWGLVRAGPGDTLSVGAMGPAAVTPDFAVVEKPVVYFHLQGGAALDVTSATIAATGEIREFWPQRRHHEESSGPLERVVFSPFTLRAAEHCAVPSFADQNDCARLDPGEACETLELARAIAPGVACLTFHEPELEAPFLFYRARTRALTVPLTAAYLDFGDINVSNTSDLPMPGRLIRFERSGGTVRALVVDPPAPHETILVGHDFAGPDVARAAITASFTELGLTTDEASAFLASWDAAFFGNAQQDVVEIPVAEVTEELPPPETSILYFLPATEIDRLASLSFDPAPSAVHRAMAVWTTLR